MTYVYVRLSNGDELIGKFIHQTNMGLTLEYPMVIEERTDVISGRTALVLSKYMLFGAPADEKVTLSPYHIIAQCEPKPEIVSYYHISKDYAERVTNAKIMQEIQRVNESQESKTDSFIDTSPIDSEDIDDIDLAMMKPYSKLQH